MNDRFKFKGYWYNEVQEVWWTYEDPEFITGDGTAEIWSDSEGGAIQEADDKLILCQCTGLKDKNGNLIYEGDILGDSYELLYVHYCKECKQFQLKSKDYGCMACEGDIHWYEVVEDDGKLEVVGNIYENEELLNG